MYLESENDMKILTTKNRRIEYQIKIGDTWRKFAVALRHPLFYNRWDLYFLDYGEFESKCFGNDEIHILSNDWIHIDEAIEKTKPIVQKKLYKIADEIMSGLRVVESEEADEAL